MSLTKPSRHYKLTDFRKPGDLSKGLDAIYVKIQGQYARRKALLESLKEETLAVSLEEKKFKNIATPLLKRHLRDASQKVRLNKIDSFQWRIDTLAALREAARREVGLFPHEPQIMGALALYRGYLAEMMTGEGKTLTAVLAAVLAGWSGKPCHVVTVNDYLARRDAQWHEKLYRFCGLTVASVTADLELNARKRAYGAAVVYTTSKELLADFLRDQTLITKVPQGERRHLLQSLGLGTQGFNQLVMRGLHTAIIDEADSILIDEAITPLILSRSGEDRTLEPACRYAVQLSDRLIEGEHYKLKERYREAKLNEAGYRAAEEAAAKLPGIWKGAARRTEILEQALSAKHFYLKDREYIVEEGKVVIVDSFTGRSMPGRSWRAGLHQMIEAREGVEMTPVTETVARLSFQRFFRLFHKLSGMTGTAWEAADEFWQVYRLPVICIPTHKPVQRNVLPDRFFPTRAQKWWAVTAEIKRLKTEDRPVLVGLRSVKDSEHLAQYLNLVGVEFEQLNAVYQSKEAEVIQMAGQLGRVTLATHMAGRGTDIKLGKGVAELGGLHVLCTERLESGRVDRQLIGRCARQGDPGSAQFFLSMEDDLALKYISPMKRKSLLERSAEAESEDLDSWRFGQHLILEAQKKAERDAYSQRKQVLMTDTWLTEALGFGSEAVV